MKFTSNTEVAAFLFFFLLLFIFSFHFINTVKAVDKRTSQITLTPDQIKKAVCTGVKDVNGTYVECTVFPVGSEL